MFRSINLFTTISFLFFALTFVSCDKEQKGCTDINSDNYDSSADSDDGSCVYSPKLRFTFNFDSMQERLGNFGEPSTIQSGHAAQSPKFNTMGVHYIELSKEKDIPAYNGTVLFQGPTTEKGGAKAIDFNQALYGGQNEEFFNIKLNQIEPGTYKYLRMSLSYQNYTIDFTASGFPLQGTIASFVGSNTYIDKLKIKDQSIDINSNKLQGFWAFETNHPSVPLLMGQAPAGATTVPNPLAAFSAIPPGSCLVTGIFDPPLVITGDESSDQTIITSISTNKSFEWIDENNNSIFDPSDGEKVVDMGVRGLIPSLE